MQAFNAPCCARFSKKPLLTVRRGQLSSLKMGVGGSSSVPSPPTCGKLPSPISCARAAASSSMPCVFAVTYARACCPAAAAAGRRTSVPVRMKPLHQAILLRKECPHITLNPCTGADTSSRHHTNPNRIIRIRIGKKSLGRDCSISATDQHFTEECLQKEAWHNMQHQPQVCCPQKQPAAAGGAHRTRAES